MILQDGSLLAPSSFDSRSAVRRPGKRLWIGQLETYSEGALVLVELAHSLEVGVFGKDALDELVGPLRFKDADLTNGFRDPASTETDLANGRP